MKTKIQKFSEGIGAVKFWGYGPALDLSTLAPCVDSCEKSSSAPSLKALCVFPGDIMSALLTMSRLGRAAPQREMVHVYVMEQHPEVLARHLLLLSIFIDPDLGEFVLVCCFFKVQPLLVLADFGPMINSRHRLGIPFTMQHCILTSCNAMTHFCSHVDDQRLANRLSSGAIPNEMVFPHKL